MNDQLSTFNTNRSNADRLPARVVRTIIDQQNAGERLVGWFKLSFLALFGSLYAVAPKAVSTEKTYEILPWFLMVYFLLTVIRLIVAYRSRIPEPLLYVSVIVDMGLLLGMIWAFHIQYQQPPSFYLKAPTLLYVFIFIALRALRFEARFVIVAGIVAAVGWMTLADYQSKMVPIIQGHGGTIDKFLGDGIMGTFGAAVTSETFAADALKTVDAVMTATDNWPADLQSDKKPLLKIGAAVTTGRIIFGAVGDTSRMEYTVIGDAVNLAAKLEKHTKSEGVLALCTVSAYETARKQGYQPPVGRKILENRNIEGVSQPQDIVVLSP